MFSIILFIYIGSSELIPGGSIKDRSNTGSPPKGRCGLKKVDFEQMISTMLTEINKKAMKNIETII